MFILICLTQIRYVQLYGMLVFHSSLHDGGIRAADAHHEIAEGTVDILTATLHGRVVRSIHQVNCHVGSLKNKNTFCLDDI